MANCRPTKTASFEPDKSEDAASAGDMRAAPRASVVIRAAKLIAGQRELLCIIRNISRTGLMIRAFEPLPKTEGLILETETGACHEVDLIWTDGLQAGLRFRAPIEVEGFLKDTEKPFSRRPVRLATTLVAEVRTDGGLALGRIVNISRSGAQIECARHLALDERVCLSISGMPLIAARIRWRSKPFYGVTFENAFRLDELGRLLAEPSWSTAESSKARRA